jgi:DNA polymerase-3 subunit gamma/tau
MLSTKAFNALLKTLEEPPENIVFVFATTEVKKVPITILSRCQKFFLKAIKPEEIANKFSWECGDHRESFGVHQRLKLVRK